MTQVMNLITQYNALIIQVIFSVILILVLVYIYRAFFLSSSVTGSSDSDAEINELNQKLNLLLQQQKNPSMSAASAPQMVANSAAVFQEVDQLKTEVLKLRSQLNESEKKVFEMVPTGPSIGSSLSSATEAAFGVASAAVPPNGKIQIEELTQKVEQLQSRLSEYDIIADDIAELSQLRSENSEMKKKFNSIVQTAPPTEIVQKENVVEEIKSSPITDMAQAVDDMFLDLNVAEAEKDLMSDFEKSTQKGSS